MLSCLTMMRMRDEIVPLNDDQLYELDAVEATLAKQSKKGHVRIKPVRETPGPLFFPCLADSSDESCDSEDALLGDLSCAEASEDENILVSELRCTPCA